MKSIVDVLNGKREETRGVGTQMSYRVNLLNVFGV